MRRPFRSPFGRPGVKRVLRPLRRECSALFAPTVCESHPSEGGRNNAAHDCQRSATIGYSAHGWGGHRRIRRLLRNVVALWGRYPAPRQVRVLNYNDESTNYTDECIPTNCAVGLFIVAPTKHCIRCHSMVLLSVVLALGTCYNAVVAYALAQTSAGVIPLRDKQTGAAEVRSWFGLSCCHF